jgi:hypothetical protein
LGITPEELAAIGEDSIREQAKWLAKDKVKWREQEEMRWRGEVREVREDRERGKWENREGAEEVEWQERNKTTQEGTTVTRPRSTPPLPVHPESATAQLGLTPEEAQAVHEECIRAQEEIQREIEEEDRVRHQRMAEQDAHGKHQRAPQEYKGQYKPPVAPTLHNDDCSINRRDPLHQAVGHRPPTPTTHPELERHAHEDCGTAYKPPTVAMPYDNDDIVVSNRGDTPPSGYQPQLPNPTSNAQPPLQPPDYDEYTTSSHDPHSTLFGYHENEGDVAPMEPDPDLAIEQLAHEMFASGDTGVNWAEEMDEMGLQGEYMVSSYSLPPALPSPAPWYPPHPPTLDHPPPPTHHLPPHRWYNPQETQIHTPTHPVPPPHAPCPETTCLLRNATASHDRD